MVFLPPGKHLEYGTVLGDERAILNEKEDASHGSFEHLADGTVQGVQEEGELLAPAHMGSREFDAAQKSRTSGGNLGQVLLADDARDVPRGVIATDDAPVVQEADDGAQRLIRGALVQFVRFAGVKREGGPLNRAPRMSILAETLVLQALSVALQQDKDITPQQYVKWHPGGSLGKLREDEKK